MRTSGGRAATAPTVASVTRSRQRQNKELNAHEAASVYADNLAQRPVRSAGIDVATTTCSGGGTHTSETSGNVGPCLSGKARWCDPQLGCSKEQCQIVENQAKLTENFKKFKSVHAHDASALHKHNCVDVARTEGLERAAVSVQQLACADLSHAEEPESDRWIEEPTYSVRIHESSRNCTFTPPRVAGIPPRQALAAVRITEGWYVDNGEEFRMVDNWTGRSAHKALQRRWTGRTTFLRVSLLNHTFL